MRYRLLCVLALAFCLTMGGGEPDMIVESQPLLDLLTEINWQRTEHGLTPVGINEQLQAAAMERAAQQAAQGFADHDRPESWRTLLDRYGVEPPRGEVLAHDFLLPQDVVPAWLTSPGHRKVMLDPEYHIVGVGLAWNGPRAFWVGLFAGEIERAEP